MKVATKQTWTLFDSTKIRSLEDYAICVGGIWEAVVKKVVETQEAYHSDVMIDAVQVAMKLHSLKIDDGEEEELCRVGIRRLGTDSTAMIQGRGYDPEVYIGGIYKLTVTRDGHAYDFQWYKYESNVNK
mgnify:FL=1